MSFAISVVNFNSIKVQLERPYPIYQDVSDAHFNSIKVQLEHKGGDPEEFKQMNFNSIKVQLELCSDDAYRLFVYISIP